MRVAIVRTGLVLGRNGGALAKLLPLFRLGFGGPVAAANSGTRGSISTTWSALYLLAIDGYDGPLNATAPQAGHESRLHADAGRGLHRPALFPAPGVRAEAGLRRRRIGPHDGQRVLPDAALAAGFTFRYPEIARGLRAA